ITGINFDVKSLKLGDVHQPCFCVFDVLYLNGQVLTNKPLRDRMRALQGMFTPEEGILAYTDRSQQDSQVMEELNAAIDRRLEGIVLKDPGSVYKPNTRKGGWYKIKPETVFKYYVSTIGREGVQALLIFADKGVGGLDQCLRKTEKDGQN
ncbi:unnamed protein product, partial [Timema podura]|nr:unnamed protein product [Timema podura]